MAKEDDRLYLLTYIENRFGIPEALFDDYLLFSTKKSWLLIKRSLQIETASRLKVSKVGLRAFQRIGSFVKPTTRFIQTFGRFASKAKLQINMTQLQTLLGGGEIPVDLKLDNGYVVLAIRANRVLGLGFLINGKIRSQLPKKEIRSAMLLENSQIIESLSWESNQIEKILDRKLENQED
ncbi:MAG: hypothetical protein ISR61_08985 [Desulfobacteraceae bacterium]|uniref:rRNA small subunit methyltransferase F RNA-binding PUA-like domain-containing protein n=1 Tax=Candidatus Desulfacyla euxinica TaxID=2841693 RepID=A0A8J6N2K8_9DELT|nr:hypothetical protein [Candidatus Desulfacyla euxinica]MBL6979071.1 hypothetical protein [Desulfobacteraceae bacterium]